MKITVTRADIDRVEISITESRSGTIIGLSVEEAREVAASINKAIGPESLETLERMLDRARNSSDDPKCSRLPLPK